MARRTRVTGLEEMRKTVAALKEEVRDELAAANEKSADELVKRIKRAIPVGPPENGHLRDTVRKERGDHELSVRVVEGSEEQPHAAPLEFGHMAKDGSRVPPQPHFFTSVTVERKKHQGRATRAVNKAIKKVTKPT